MLRWQFIGIKTRETMLKKYLLFLRLFSKEAISKPHARGM